MTFLAAQNAVGLGLETVRGGVWWQTVGGLLAVFGLLLLCLKLLGRFNRARCGSKAELLGVLTLGPKREVQILRLGDEVHYIYRHDGAMVVLRQLPLAEYRADSSVPSGPAAGGWRGVWGRITPRSAAAQG